MSNRHTSGPDCRDSADPADDLWGDSLSDAEGDLLPPPPTADAQGCSDTVHPQRPWHTRFGPFGDYELLHEIARGGMGVVYKARHKSLDRIVAVKMIRDGALAGSEEIARFQAEAAAAAGLRHPNIVAVHDVGTDRGQHFYSMDFIEGTCLAAHAHEHPLSTTAAASLVQTIAEAVQAAHNQGVLHRDLKPSNVLIDASGQPHVTDFGLAKRLTVDSNLTGTEQILGTPGYIPPEQALGRRHRGDFAADVYSLGAILYDLLTGRPPFRGETAMETIRQVLETEPVSPRRLNPSVSRDLETICMKCLEKDPWRRYPTAHALAEELGRTIRGEPIQARPLGRVSRGWRWCRRHPARAFVALLVLTLAVGGPATAYWTTDLLRQTQTADKQRVGAQVRALRTAEPEAVAAIVGDLRRDWTAVEPQLTALWGDAALTDRERSRLSVALLPQGNSYRDYAYRRLHVADAREFDMLRQALLPYRRTFVDDLWKEMESARHDAGRQTRQRRQRMNVAASLAAYDPQNEQWPHHAGRVAGQLVSLDSLSAAAWAGYFEPVTSHLVPHLREVYRRTDETQAAKRALAADLLSRYAAGDVELLAELLTTANAREFGIFMSRLETHSAAAEVLRRAFDRCSAKQPGGIDDPNDAAVANLAIALFRLNSPEHVRLLLRHSADPTVRTLLIHRLLPFGSEADVLADWLEADAEVSVRRAIVLALGEVDPADLSPGLRDRLIGRLESLIHRDADTGVYAAAEWTLRQWGLEDQVPSLPNASLGHDPNSPLGRYVTSQGHVMAVVRGPVEFQSGGKTIRIERSFAFAIKELTREQYLRFESDPQIQAKLEGERKANNQPGRHWYNESWAQSFGPDPQCPHLSIPWTVGAQYCRWLSEQEGVSEAEQCFPPDPTSGEAVELPRNYLGRTGYRMPTAAEWEYMCRAGSGTERFFGRSTNLLGKYAWYVPNSQQRSWPVGRLKPNDLGVFDIFGNIREWCLNRQGARPKVNADGIAFDVEEANPRIEMPHKLQTCGGCYNDHARFIRAGSRETGHEMFVGNNLNGLRLARTLKLDD